MERYKWTGMTFPLSGRADSSCFFPVACCLEPVQMSHIVSYLARTLVFLQQLKHVDLPQVAFQSAALPRPADFLREQEDGGVLDLGEVRIALWAKAEFFCHSDFP